LLPSNRVVVVVVVVVVVGVDVVVVVVVIIAVVVVVTVLVLTLLRWLAIDVPSATASPRRGDRLRWYHQSQPPRRHPGAGLG
jgi:hypothetical protein